MDGDRRRVGREGKLDIRRMKKGRRVSLMRGE
jgi:hypothetical protein